MRSNEINGILHFSYRFFLLFSVVFLLFSCSSLLKPEITSISITDGMIVEEPGEPFEIRIVFSTDMNQYSVESNITITNYEGTVTYLWDSDRELTLYLQDGFEPGQKIIIEINSSCESSTGLDLGEYFRYRLYTYEEYHAFDIVSSDPADGSEVTLFNELEVRISFNRALKNESIMDKIDISNSVEFSYYLDNGDTELVLVLHNLSPGKYYTVTVSSELRSVDGIALEEDKEIMFFTHADQSDFYLLSAFAGESAGDTMLDILQGGITNGITKNTKIFLHFSKKFLVSDAQNNMEITPSVTYSAVLTDTGTDYLLTLTFDETLDSETSYCIKINGSFQDLDNSTIDQSYFFYFVTDAADSLYQSVSKISLDSSILSTVDLTLTSGEVIVYQSGSPSNNEEFAVNVDSHVFIRVEFNSNADVIRSLDGFNFQFLLGNSGAASADLFKIYYNDAHPTVIILEYELGAMVSEEEEIAYYTLSLTAEDIYDINGNTMQEDIGIVVFRDETA